MSSKGLVIVVSAPSGAGKSTLCNLLMKRFPKLRYSISYTTRPRRPGEKDGSDYFFVTEKTFRAMARTGKFVEWAKVHGHYYGTPRKYIDAMVRKGYDIALDIDVQGGRNIRRAYPEAVLIFIMAPSMADLKRRLVARRQDSAAVIERRLANARRELASLPKYDYLVINDDIAKAERELASIITAEHHRVRHLGKIKFN